MRNNFLKDYISSTKLIFSHYLNYLIIYPKHRGIVLFIPIFKLIISSIIFQITITSKKIFTNFYNFLKSKKKLKFTVKKIVTYDKKLKATNKFFIYIFNKYLDKSKTQKKTLYIDITQFRNAEYKSGIQRVVDNIIRELNKKKQKKFNISYFYFPRVCPNA